MAAPPPSARRDDIQGLRAIAVLMVMAAHAGLPTPGGFVGVDVFFVISGFVITAMLQREWQRSGRIALGSFYLRRVKRLTPALVTTVAVTVLLSLLVLPPFGDQQAAALTGLGALGLCANIVISIVSGDYFAPAAEGNPLLHTWSLSVEEQFYLVFPALIVGAMLLGRRTRHPWLVPVAALLAVTAASLVAIGAIPWESPVGGYYGPFPRAWEFTLGALVAFGGPWLRRLPARLSLPLAVAGLAAILASLWLIGPATPFPGKWALLPTLGACAVMAAGCGASNVVSRVLALPAMTWIGDRSYSLYLWHWPAVVFARNLVPFAWGGAVWATLLSVLPALACYHWIEQRYRFTDTGFRPLLRLGARTFVPVVALAALAYPLAGAVAQGFRSGALPSPHRVATKVGTPSAAVPCEVAPVGPLTACWQAHPGRPVTMAMIGDSHAEHLYGALVAANPGVNLALYAVRGPEVFGSADDRLALFHVFEANPHLRVVMISRAWELHGLDAERARDLRAIVSRLALRGVRVLLPEDVPLWGFGSTQCQYAIAPAVPLTRCEQPASFNAEKRDPAEAVLTQLAADFPQVARLRTRDAFCGDQCSMLAPDGRTVYFTDNSHLGVEGSAYLADFWANHSPAYREALASARADG